MKRGINFRDIKVEENWSLIWKSFICTISLSSFIHLNVSIYRLMMNGKNKKKQKQIIKQLWCFTFLVSLFMWIMISDKLSLTKSRSSFPSTTGIWCLHPSVYSFEPLRIQSIFETDHTSHTYVSIRECWKVLSLNKKLFQ